MTRRLLATALLALAAGGAPAQQTQAFLDTFSRAAVSPGGTPAVAYTTSGAGAASVVSSSFLQMTNGGVAGGLSVGGPTAGFAGGYSPTLGQNQSVTWQFNARWNGTSGSSPGGLVIGSNGLGVVLAADGPDFTTGSGYAVVYDNGGAVDPVRLVRYAGGLPSVSALATDNAIVSTDTQNNLAATNDYFSVRVTYTAAANAWQLQVRDDGAAGWTDPATSAGYTTLGAGTDGTLTGTALNSFGFYYAHGTASPSVQFDNFQVLVVPVPEPAAAGLLAAAGLGLARRARRPLGR